MNWERLLLIYGLLVAFGYAYNRKVAGWQQTGRDEGLTALEVVAGVLVTLSLSAGLLWGRTFDALALLLLLGAFGASGACMAAGSLGRYIERRARAQAALKARHALRLIVPLLEGETMTQTEIVRRLGLAVADLQAIDKLMIGAGAPKEC